MIAMVWPSHVHHHAAQEWFTRNRGSGFKTCPITQAGLVRVISHPRYGRDGVSVAEAHGVLDELIALPEHGFWPDDLPLAEAFKQVGPLTGHRQITDAYLLALAIAKGGALATFDRGVLALRGAKGNAELITS